jgi:DNA-binding CsgD family transcriptional regulator
LEQIGAQVVALDKDKPEKIGNALLSPRQEECLRGVLELKSAKQIARDLGISPHAVEKHLRLCREKFGVTTTAEAARKFARLQGSDFPHSGVSGLVALGRSADEGVVLEHPVKPSLAALEDTFGVLSGDHPLTPRQTLLTIAAVSFASIVGLLLLVACAEGIRRLVSH